MDNTENKKSEKIIRKTIVVCGLRLYEERVRQLLSALSAYASKRGYFVMALSANSDSLSDSDSIAGDMQFFDLLKIIDISALIVISESLKYEMFLSKIVNIGKDRGVPVFCTDRFIEGCYNINFDYKTGFEMMVRHIVEHHGKRRVNMMAGIKGNSFSEERLDMYKKVLEENNIPIERERIGYGDFWEVPTKAAMEIFLSSDIEMPEAIVCANDSMAITVCDVLNKYGYKVPEDVIITGFDGLERSFYNHPPISTCIPNYDELSVFIVTEVERFDFTGIFEPYDYLVGFNPIYNMSCNCTDIREKDKNDTINRLISDNIDCAWHVSAMNYMMTSSLDKVNLWDLTELLPKNLKLWSHIFTFAAIKLDVMEYQRVPEEFGDMSVIVESKIGGGYEKPGITFKAKDIMPDYERLLFSDSGYNILAVRSLNAGKNVYGYVAQAFGTFTDRDMSRLDEFGMFLTDSIYSVMHNRRLNDLNEELKKANSEITKLSERDSMTNIYNRRGFYQKLSELIINPRNYGKELYLISLDMDNLKVINDSFGHAEGDYALITIAKALKANLSQYGVFARYGGDEFSGAIILDQNSDIDMNNYEKMFKTAVKEVDGVEDKPYDISASIGVAHHVINDDLNVDELIREADHIMYDNKQKKKVGRK